MVLLGTYKNGVVVLDEKIGLPDGQRVQVNLEPSNDRAPTVWQKLLELSGCIKDGPADASVNHDHYLYGAAKRDPSE